MKITHLFYLVLFLLFISATSCKKEDPKPNAGAAAGTPVFSFSGSIDGIPVSFQAGENDYYMSTSCILDANGIYDFIGELKLKNCSGNCSNSLRISIKNDRLLSVSPAAIDSALVSGYYAFATPSGASSLYRSIFISGITNGTAQSYTWNFGDGTTTIVNSPSVTHTYLHPGIYKVSLIAESTDGCISTIANNVQFGQTGNAFLSQFQVSIKGDTATLIPIPVGGISPFTYAWNFGNGNTSVASKPSHKYATAGVYKASLTMTDLTGTSSVQYMNISIKNSTYCSAYFIMPSPTPLGNPMNLGNVEVEWTDGNGKIWTSKSDSQSSSKSMFKIISVEDYLISPNGNATKKLHVNFSCTLYNGFESITIYNGEAVFSVAYK